MSDALGCSAVTTITVPLPKMDESDADRLNINIYPNPSSGIIQLSVNECSGCVYGIRLYNSIGEMVFKKYQKIESTSTLDLSHLPKGIYNFFISKEEIGKTVRIVIQ